VADQTHCHQPDQVQLVIFGTNQRIRVLERDSVFCSNTECVLHVRSGDVNVKGNGNWAETADGVITGRQRVGTVMLCDQCAVLLVRSELTLHGECAA
jgi:hypothetical protein